MNDNSIRLTEYSRGSGCGCKISPAVLKEILSTTDDFPLPLNLLVGNDTNDDAAVLELENDLCIISTTDFFMPVVNDATTYGKIAAANAMSDVYAMGGKPFVAVAILGWPVDRLPAALARETTEGARFICRLAGVALAGGHSVDSVEPFFGLAVTGSVMKKNIRRNNTAKKGDHLFLTKPLGVGIVNTAHKRNMVREEDLQVAVSYMTTLNKAGEAFARISGVNAITDVTGFGLIGHLLEMCDQGRLSAELRFGDLPVIPGLKFYLDQMIYPDMTMKNFSAFSSQCSTLGATELLILCEPQTSGGLLVAVEDSAVDEYLETARSFGLQGIADRPVGKFVDPGDKVILVR